MNICFVSNFSKTILYREIANKLKENGYNIFWVFVDSTLVKYANNDKYILLGLSYAKKELTKQYDISINEIFTADRYLSQNKKNGMRYLINIQNPLYDFIKDNNIKYIFGERTWGHELVLSRLVKRYSELNCKYYSFETVRIPSNRFYFYDDEEQNNICGKNSNQLKIDFDIKKPDYMVKNNSILKKQKNLIYKLNLIKRFITKENIVKDNPCLLHSTLQRFKKGFIEERNKLFYKIIKKQKFEKYENEKYIFYGMHKQPEASIDICGMYFEDQYQNIFNLWRILPPNWFLLVKEHTVGIGDRDYHFYKKIMALKNVILINENEDSYKIIRNSQLTATVTGTIALEAGLMGKNAITFGNPYFTRLPNVRNITYKQLADKKTFNEIINFEPTPQDINNYKNFIIENSFEGNVLDPVTDPNVLNDININNVLNAFLSLIND